MKRRVRAGIVSLALTGLVAVIADGPEAAARTVQTPPQVGRPGCADDVPVRATRTLIRFESRGRPIRGWLYRPGGPANGIGLVMLHGGTGFEMNSILFDAHAIQLASRGYSVLLPAYFDAGAPDRSRRVVTARAWRQAALDAATRLAQEPGVEPGEVVLWGYSRGAGVAVDAMAASDGAVRSAVLAAGGGSFDDRFTQAAPAFLLLHARSDEAVPVRATLKLAEDLAAAGAGVAVHELDFDGHQYDLPTWCAVMDRTRTFLEQRREPGDGPA